MTFASGPSAAFQWRVRPDELTPDALGAAGPALAAEKLQMHFHDIEDMFALLSEPSAGGGLGVGWSDPIPFTPRLAAWVPFTVVGTQVREVRDYGTTVRRGFYRRNGPLVVGTGFIAGGLDGIGTGPDFGFATPADCQFVMGLPLPLADDALQLIGPDETSDLLSLGPSQNGLGAAMWIYGGSPAISAWLAVIQEGLGEAGGMDPEIRNWIGAVSAQADASANGSLNDTDSGIWSWDGNFPPNYADNLSYTFAYMTTTSGGGSGGGGGGGSTRSGAKITTYSSDGTWEPESTSVAVTVKIWGGGGQGGGGASGTNAAVRQGGSGGGGGGFVERNFKISDLTTPVAVTIGLGGIGAGAGGGTGGAAGGDGTAGGDTTFGLYCKAFGGGGGAGGPTIAANRSGGGGGGSMSAGANGSGSTAVGGGPAQVTGAHVNGESGASSTVNADGWSTEAGGGGGGGAGSGSSCAGGQSLRGGGGGGGGGSGGSAQTAGGGGGAAAYALYGHWPGSGWGTAGGTVGGGDGPSPGGASSGAGGAGAGGGGGSTSTSVKGGDGGAAGTPGGGGGGGGGARSGGTAVGGTGGAGGDGYAEIIEW